MTRTRTRWPAGVFIYVFCACHPSAGYATSTRRVGLSGWCYAA